MSAQAVADPNLDARADIYSLGAVAYEMLVGEQLFDGLTAHRQLAAHAMETPVPLSERRSDIPPALDRLIMQCLHKGPDDRPPTADAVLYALDGIVTAGGRVRPSAMKTS